MTLLIALIACTCAGESSAAGPVWPPARDQGRIPGEVVRDVIGINEAIGVPRRFALQLTPEERSRRIDDRIEKVEALGVRHVRMHSNVYPYLNYHEHQTLLDGDWSHADAVITRVLDAGLEPLVMISPWPGNAPARVTDEYAPPEGYTQWVKQVVERYDGDGIEDAPALTGGVRLWEVDNEPDLHHFVPPRGRQGFDPRGFSTPTQVRDVVRSTAEAVHEADPDAVVLPGGLWKVEGKHEDYARSLWAEPFGDWVDGFNIHAYPKRIALDPTPLLDDVATDEPVWITEISTPSIGPRGESGQAMDLLTLVLEALHGGLVRVYWHALVESADFYAPHRRQMTRGRHLYVGDQDDVVGRPPRWKAVHPKLSARVLRRFLERWGDVPRKAVRALAVDGAHGLAFGEDRFYWGDGRVRIALEGKHAVVVPLVPPDADSELDWTGQTRRVKRGQLQLDLTDGPVWVRAVEEDE